MFHIINRKTPFVITTPNIGQLKNHAQLIIKNKIVLYCNKVKDKTYLFAMHNNA